jgi:hypothetical protein
MDVTKGYDPHCAIHDRAYLSRRNTSRLTLSLRHAQMRSLWLVGITTHLNDTYTAASADTLVILRSATTLK